MSVSTFLRLKSNREVLSAAPKVPKASAPRVIPVDDYVRPDFTVEGKQWLVIDFIAALRRVCSFKRTNYRDIGDHSVECIGEMLKRDGQEMKAFRYLMKQHRHKINIVCNLRA